MAPALKIKSVIGFNGKVARSLHYTPCGKYIVFPLGSFIVIKNLVTEKEAFIDGHSNNISCLTISQDGSKMASGQINIPGVKVRVLPPYVYTPPYRAFSCLLFVQLWVQLVALPFCGEISANLTLRPSPTFRLSLSPSLLQLLIRYRLTSLCGT